MAQSTFLSSGTPEQKINTSTQFLLRWGDFKQKQNKSLFCITWIYKATDEFFCLLLKPKAFYWFSQEARKLHFLGDQS